MPRFENLQDQRRHLDFDYVDIWIFAIVPFLTRRRRFFDIIRKHVVAPNPSAHRIGLIIINRSAEFTQTQHDMLHVKLIDRRPIRVRAFRRRETKWAGLCSNRLEWNECDRHCRWKLYSWHLAGSGANLLGTHDKPSRTGLMPGPLALWSGFARVSLC